MAKFVSSLFGGVLAVGGWHFVCSKEIDESTRFFRTSFMRLRFALENNLPPHLRDDRTLIAVPEDEDRSVLPERFRLLAKEITPPGWVRDPSGMLRHAKQRYNECLADLAKWLSS